MVYNHSRTRQCGEKRLEQPRLLEDEPENEQAADADANGKEQKRANDLDGATWTKYSVSIWSDIRKTKEEADLGHPAIFPAQLVTRLIECLTRSYEQTILDPFCGSGSTVAAAARMGRVGVGFEINPDYVALARHRLSVRELWQPAAEKESVVYQDDARNLARYLAPNSVDMVITSPPYWDILSQKRTADGKAIRDYGDAEQDLGKIGDYDAFLEELKQVFRPVYTVLKPGKYCVSCDGLRKKNRFYSFHADIATMMQSIGYVFDD
jgi:DNA modification methylase